MGRENKTIFVILGLLNQKPLTGYEIKKRIDNELKYFWDTSFGQIYPTLSTLEQNGWVSKSVEHNGQRVERIIYTITQKGRDKLKAWLILPPDVPFIKYEILLKLYFGSLIDVQENIANIVDFKQTFEDQLPTLDLFESELDQIKDQNPDHLHYLLTVLFGKKIYKAYVEWSEEAIGLLSEYQDKKNAQSISE